MLGSMPLSFSALASDSPASFSFCGRRQERGRVSRARRELQTAQRRTHLVALGRVDVTQAGLDGVLAALERRLLGVARTLSSGKGRKRRGCGVSWAGSRGGSGCKQ